MKMTRTFTQSLLGLLVTLSLVGLIYLLGNYLQLFSISTANPVVVLLTGLVTGYIAGAFISSKSAGNALKNAPSAGDVRSIYVGNLPFKISRNELRALFEPYGKVHSARIMIDKATRKPRGYGFVEMKSENASKAINKLNGSLLDGRNIKVNEANQRS
jgi:hypothetical protein